MITWRPRIYIKNPEELPLWEAFINQAKQSGIKGFAIPAKQPFEKQTIEESADNIDITLDATGIKTKEELIKACNIDTSLWEVASFRVSTWQQKEGGGQLYSVRCNLKKRVGIDSEKYISLLEKVLKSSTKPAIEQTFKSDALKTSIAVISIFDAHIDKVTRETETGESIDIDAKAAQFIDAFDYLLSKCGDVHTIIFPVGNDFFNVNDARSTTKKGTPQDSNTSFIDAFEIGLKVVCACIEKAAKVAKVQVPIIAGNHAEDLEYLLGVALASIYKSSPQIEVNHSRKYRKYYKSGQNLIMFAHGDKLKNKVREIPNIIATEEPELWASTSQRYAIFGDIHHEQTHDLTGVKAMFLRSMSHQDKWHHAEGYISLKRTAYLHTFSDCGRFTSTQTINF